MNRISRRVWLLRTAAGAAALAAGMARLRLTLAAEGVAQGVARVRGEVLIGGKPAVRGMEVRPGDVITTGTPPGVALGMKPPKWLNPGDVMTLGIDGLGEQKQKVVPFKGKR